MAEATCPLCGRVVETVPSAVDSGRPDIFTAHHAWESGGRLGPPCQGAGRTYAEALELYHGINLLEGVHAGRTARMVSAGSVEAVEVHLGGDAFRAVIKGTWWLSPGPAVQPRTDRLFGMEIQIDRKLPPHEWQLRDSVTGRILYRGTWDTRTALPS